MILKKTYLTRPTSKNTQINSTAR